MRRAIWLTALALALAACRRDPPMVCDDHRTLLPPEEGARYQQMFRGGTPPRGSFVPTAREIDALETRLPALLRAQAAVSIPPNPVPLAERAPKYRRQYVAYIDGAGNKRIWGNFFCRYDERLFGDTWKASIFVMSDGGDCYFNVEFSPEDLTFRNLMINGDA